MRVEPVTGFIPRTCPQSRLSSTRKDRTPTSRSQSPTLSLPPSRSSRSQSALSFPKLAQRFGNESELSITQEGVPAVIPAEMCYMAGRNRCCCSPNSSILRSPISREIGGTGFPAPQRLNPSVATVCRRAPAGVASGPPGRSARGPSGILSLGGIPAPPAHRRSARASRRPCR